MKGIQGFLSTSWDHLCPESKCALLPLLEGNITGIKVENRLVLEVREAAWGERWKERSGAKQSNGIQLQLNWLGRLLSPLPCSCAGKIHERGSFTRTACTAPVHFHHFQWPLKWLAASVPVFALEIVWCCDIFVLHCHVVVRKVEDPSIYT